MNIETLRAKARDGTAQGTFIVVGDTDPQDLKGRLEEWLTGAGDSPNRLTVVR